MTNEIFDASKVDPNTIRFGPAGAQEIHRDKNDKAKQHLEDVDNDNDLDLILHFDTRSLKLTSTNTEAILSARLKDNALIKGTDSVRIVGELGFLASIINATRGIIDTIIGVISNFFGLQ